MSYSERDDDVPNELESRNVLQRIKQNDPKITYMEFVFLYGHGSHVRDRFVTSVDWDTEQWSFFENSHLLSITIDICLLDNTKNKSRNATPKDLDNVRSFTKALARNRSIKNIRLVGDPSIIGDIFTNVSPMFGRLHGLQLINTTFTNDSIQKLKMAIESSGQSELQEIELSCNHTTNAQAGTIIDAINGHCNNLKKLVWGSDNGEGLFQGSDGFLALANLVGNPSSVLEVLDLGNDDSYTRWDDSMPEFGGKLAFATAIANNSTLKVINFGGWSNSFTTSEWQTVLSILRHNSIEEIYLYGQQIGVEGMNAIALGLSNNTSLKKLDLSDCGGVTFACLASLSDEIQNNRASALETLDISSHITRRELTTSITRILIDNTSLKELSLCGQWDTRDDIIIELANVLENNDTLKVLNLGTLSSGIRQHHIDEDQSFGFKALTRILCNRSSVDATFMSNHTLQTVSVYIQHGHVYQSAVLPSHLTDMLTLNENSNKFEVSRQKILQCHFDEDTQQEFVNMELEVLPHALAWCGEDQRGVSLLLRIIQSFPSLFDSNSKRNKAAAAEKRKRNE